MRDWLPIEDESTPFNVDVELWGPRINIRWGRHQVVGMINSGTFDRAWVDIQGGIIEPTHWRPIRPPADGSDKGDLCDELRAALLGLVELFAIREGSDVMEPLCTIEKDRLADARAVLAKAGVGE